MTLPGVQARQRPTRSRILVVEDDRFCRELIALALDDTYDVLHAMTAAEAMRIFAEQIVAAVVLDFRLPDATGLDVLMRLRSARPHVPVIMITGFGSEWLCASALRLGVWDYFPKPMNVLDLVQSLERALSTSPASREGRPLAVAASRQNVASTDMRIQKVIQLIRHRYWDHLSLELLAREIGMSKYRLSHRFSREVGMSFRAYLLRVRLDRARELLATGRVSISEVAQAVGFTDLPRFDKLFKRYTGLTPSAYRLRRQANRAS
jgi:two-component system response regulator YesN